jgi:hypothetical protein
LEDIDIDGGIILKWVFEQEGIVGVDFIHMEQVRDQLQTIIRAVKSLWTYEQRT